MFPVVRRISITTALLAYGLVMLLLLYDLIQWATLKAISEEIKQNSEIIQDFHTYGGMGRDAYDALAFSVAVVPVVDALNKTYWLASGGQDVERGRNEVIKNLELIDTRIAASVKGIDLACNGLLWLREQSSGLAHLKLAAIASDVYVEKPDKRALINLLEHYDRSSDTLFKISDKLEGIVVELENLDGSIGQTIELLDDEARSGGFWTSGISQGLLVALRPASDHVNMLYLYALDHQQKTTRGIALVKKVNDSMFIFRSIENIVESVPGSRRLTASDDWTGPLKLALSGITLASVTVLFVTSMFFDRRRRMPNRRQ